MSRANHVCEEANRWVLRCDPLAGTVERLSIDGTPVKSLDFDLTDPNASFEGIAVAEGRLYVADERQLGRIIRRDLANLQIVDRLCRPVSRPHAATSFIRDLSLRLHASSTPYSRAHAISWRINRKDHKVLSRI